MKSLKEPSPPRWAKQFLAWYCRPEILEDLEGDLNEFFQRNCGAKGIHYARLIYALDILKFMRWYTLRKARFFDYELSISLLKNYSIAAGRSFLRRKLDTSLKVISLTLGLTCFIVITLHVLHEFSYNTHHENHERIGRVTLQTISQNKEEMNLAWTNPQLPDELKNMYPEIAMATGIFKIKGKAVVKSGDIVFLEEDFYHADKEYFKVFTHEWIAGDISSALSKPGTIILTEKLAIKYFGATDPLNQMLAVNDREYVVTGVIQDVPSNTDLKFNALVATDSHFPDWCVTYALFNDVRSLREFQPKLDKHFDEYLRPILNQVGFDGAYLLEPLQEIHFGEEKLFDSPKAKKSVLYLFITIAFAILIISCINHVTIDLAQSMRKQQEIGIRKALGAFGRQIRIQFILESFIILMSSLVISFIILFCFAPLPGESAGIQIYTRVWSSPLLLSSAFLLLMMISAACGNYTARSFSRASIITNLKSGFTHRTRKFYRAGFVLIHLTITLALIFSTRIVSNQMKLILKSDPGYDSRSIMILDIPPDSSSYSQLPAMKTALRQLSFVSQVSLAGYYSTPTNDIGFDIYEVDQNDQAAWKPLSYIKVDEDYFNLFNIKLKEGRTFNSTDVSSRKALIVVNEALVKAMGWEETIGQTIGGNEVIGVVNDFNFYGLYRKAEPLQFRVNNDLSEKVLVKLHEVNKTNLATVKSTWNSFFGDRPFEYEFLDGYFTKYLERENILEKQLSIFSSLSVAIACLGLFATINIGLQEKMKETGMRKIFGAKLFHLLSRTCAEYIAILLIACLLTFPFASLLLNNWLEGFATKTVIGFIPAFETMLVIIALLSFAVLYQAVRVHRISPLESIKYE